MSVGYGIPNRNDTPYRDIAEPDSGDFDILAGAFGATGVAQGCAASAPGGFFVNIAAGTVVIAGQLVSVVAANLAIAAPDPDEPRFDLVTVDPTGALSVTTGGPSSNPVFPMILLPDPAVVLCSVYVPAAIGAITAAMITSKSVFLSSTNYDMVSPRTHGGIGDGVSGDSAAINLAIIDAAATRRVLDLTGGIWRIDTSLNWNHTMGQLNILALGAHIIPDVGVGSMFIGVMNAGAAGLDSLTINGGDWDGGGHGIIGFDLTDCRYVHFYNAKIREFRDTTAAPDANGQRYGTTGIGVRVRNLNYYSERNTFECDWANNTRDVYLDANAAVSASMARTTIRGFIQGGTPGIAHIDMANAPGLYDSDFGPLAGNIYSGSIVFHLAGGFGGSRIRHCPVEAPSGTAYVFDFGAVTAYPVIEGNYRTGANVSMYTAAKPATVSDPVEFLGGILSVNSTSSKGIDILGRQSDYLDMVATQLNAALYPSTSGGSGVYPFDRIGNTILHAKQRRSIVLGVHDTSGITALSVAPSEDGTNLATITATAVTRSSLAGTTARPTHGMTTQTAGTGLLALFKGGDVTTAADAGAGGLTLGGGLGTGAGAGGAVTVQTPTTLAAGVTAQTAVTRLTVSQGAVTTGAWSLTFGATGSILGSPAATLGAITATTAGFTVGANGVTITATNSATGIIATHLSFIAPAGGYGSGLRVVSTETGTSTVIAQGSIEFEGEANWNSVANASSLMRFAVALAGTLTERWRITSAGAWQAATTGSTSAPNIKGLAQAGADVAGFNFAQATGLGTGAGAGGAWTLATPTTLASSSTAQTFVTRLTVSQGAVTTGAWSLTLATGGQVLLPSGSTAASPAIASSGGSLIIGTTDTSTLSLALNGTSRWSVVNAGDWVGNTTNAKIRMTGQSAANGFNLTLQSGAATTTTDALGGSLTIADGTGTGAGAGGTIIFQTGTTLASSTTAQTLVTRLTLSKGAVTTDAWSLTFATGGALVLPSGSVALPSWYFAGSATSGAWSPAADAIAWSSGGTEVFRVDPRKRLYIGSTGSASDWPTTQLESLSGTAGVRIRADYNDFVTAGYAGSQWPVIIRNKHDGAAAGILAVYNPSATATGVGLATAFADTTGAGATAAVSLAQAQFTFDSIDHATRAARFVVSTARSGAISSRLSVGAATGLLQAYDVGSLAIPTLGALDRTPADGTGLAVWVAGGRGTGTAGGGLLVLATGTTGTVSGVSVNALAARVTVSAGAATTDVWTMTFASGGVLSLPAGAAGAPSVNFGTATTGIYGSATSIDFTVGGSAQWQMIAGQLLAANNGTSIIGTFSANGTPRALRIQSGSGVTGADIASGVLTLGSQVGTGAGGGGFTLFQSPTLLTTGTTSQTAVTRMVLSQGAVTTDAWTLAMSTNGRLTFASGGATATPGIAFTAGATAYIGTTDAQTLRIVTNGADRLVFSAGNGLQTPFSASVGIPSFSSSNSAAGTDQAGPAAVFGGGNGTGAGAPGSLTLATATTLTTGTTVQSRVARLTISGGAVTTDVSTATWAEALNFVFGTTTGTKFATSNVQKLGWWNATPVVQSAVATITNNVTVGGTDDVIADFVGAVYATDSATIRNDIYQLARKLKLTVDALRTYGLFG